MPISNIIDRRKHPHRWKAVTAIMEPTYHDNSVPGADQAEETLDDIVYDERAEISVAEALIWVQSLPFPATLYLYDLGQGINVVRADEAAHYLESKSRMGEK